jgi:hypothetical protein
MYGHHRVKQERQVNTLGFDCKLEVLTVTVEGPWALHGGDTYVRFVRAPKQSVFNHTFWRPVEDLNRTVADGDYRYYSGNQSRLDARF